MKQNSLKSFHILSAWVFLTLVMLTGCLKQPYVRDGFTATGTTLDYKETEYYDGFIWSNWEYRGFIPLVEVYLWPEQNLMFLPSFRDTYTNEQDRLLANKYHRPFDEYCSLTRIKFKGSMPDGPSRDLHNFGIVVIEEIYYLESMTTEKLDRIKKQLNDMYGPSKLK